MLSFKTSKEEKELIAKIMDRLEKITPDPYYERINHIMDLSACNASGCPLDLKRMLEGSDGDLLHDVYGINKNICRESGKLLNCFLPRYAKKRGK